MRGNIITLFKVTKPRKDIKFDEYDEFYDDDSTEI